MKLLWIENDLITDVIGKTYKAPNGKLYFNVDIGDRYDSKLWAYSICVCSKSVRTPTYIDDKIILDKNYRLAPIMKKKDIYTQRRDWLGNYQYYLEEIDNNKTRDVLIFINFPYDNFIETKFNIEGKCTLIGKGTNGKFRQNRLYKIPALVVECFGSATITFEGKVNNGDAVFREYSYTSYDNVINIRKEKR